MTGSGLQTLLSNASRAQRRSMRLAILYAVMAAASAVALPCSSVLT